MLEELEKAFPGRIGRVRLASDPSSYEETVTVEDVTPLQAMQWIAATWVKYENGRNFYPTKIEKIISYANDMQTGHWSWSPEQDPIDITDGTVTGGRHRLHAILLSHQTIRTNIRRRTKLK